MNVFYVILLTISCIKCIIQIYFECKSRILILRIELQIHSKKKQKFKYSTNIPLLELVSVQFRKISPNCPLTCSL